MDKQTNRHTQRMRKQINRRTETDNTNRSKDGQIDRLKMTHTHVNKLINVMKERRILRHTHTHTNKPTDGLMGIHTITNRWVD